MPVIQCCQVGRVTVPEGFVFKKAALSAGAGTVKIDTLSAEKLSLELGAGEVNIGKLAASTRAMINGSVGKLKMEFDG